MNALTDLQTINGADGLPAFVVVPYDEFIRQYGAKRELVPNEVVRKHVMDEMPMVKAWREHLDLTQAEVAQRAGMTQAALSQIESGTHKARKATREKLAAAMGLTLEQLG